MMTEGANFLIGLLALLIMVFSAPLLAESIEARVINVSDGDTLTLLDANNEQVKVRLQEIDAPEHQQAYGQKSKKSLSDLCYKKSAQAVVNGKDKYRRLLVRLYCNGVDVNAEQVKRGMAWAFLKYLTDPNIADLEKEAKSKKIGLWADPNPVAPWDFRHPKIPAATPARFLNMPHSERFSCEGKNAYCKSMKSCAEAMFYLKECGAAKLDRDGDGIPCEAICK